MVSYIKQHVQKFEVNWFNLSIFLSNTYKIIYFGRKFPILYMSFRQLNLLVCIKNNALVYLTRKGHVPAQALSVVYGSVQVSVYFIINMAFFAQTYQLQNEI